MRSKIKFPAELVYKLGNISSEILSGTVVFLSSQVLKEKKMWNYRNENIGLSFDLKLALIQL